MMTSSHVNYHEDDEPRFHTAMIQGINHDSMSALAPYLRGLVAFFARLRAFASAGPPVPFGSV